MVPGRFVEWSAGSETGFLDLVAVEPFKAGQIPQADGLVSARSDQSVPVRRERHLVDLIGVAG